MLLQLVNNKLHYYDTKFTCSAVERAASERCPSRPDGPTLYFLSRARKIKLVQFPSELVTEMWFSFKTKGSNTGFHFLIRIIIAREVNVYAMFY